MASTVTTIVYLVGVLAGQPNFLSYQGYGAALAVPMPNMEVCQQVKSDIEHAFVEKAGINSSNRNVLQCKVYRVK